MSTTTLTNPLTAPVTPRLSSQKQVAFIQRLAAERPVVI